jgi:hypothetical protein
MSHNNIDGDVQGQRITQGEGNRGHAMTVNLSIDSLCMPRLRQQCVSLG